jgi:hypothetical protein
MTKPGFKYTPVAEDRSFSTILGTTIHGSGDPVARAELIDGSNKIMARQKASPRQFFDFPGARMDMIER